MGEFKLCNNCANKSRDDFCLSEGRYASYAMSLVCTNFVPKEKEREVFDRKYGICSTCEHVGKSDDGYIYCKENMVIIKNKRVSCTEYKG